LSEFEGSTLKQADDLYKKEALFKETIAKCEQDIIFLKNSADQQSYDAISKSLETEKVKLVDLNSGKYN
jgi:hypothetical protein